MTRSGTMLPQVTLLQFSTPPYRVAFVELLSERLGEEFHVVAAGDDSDTVRWRKTDIRNHFFLGETFIWQRHAVRASVGAEVAVVDLNPRMLSTWLILLVRRALRRPTVLWGHAWPRGHNGLTSDSSRSTPSTDAVRHLMRRLGTAILVYTESEARDLRRIMPHELIEAAPNALYSRSAPSGADDADASQGSDFIFVGRLVDEKKPRLLLDAFLLVMDELPADARLIFVGDGPLRSELERIAESRGNDRVLFLGQIVDFERLRAIHASGLATIISGSVGLSLIQSLWFGVPSIVADAEPHGPEIEAAREGFNAVFFSSNSIVSLSNALTAVAEERDGWQRRRPEIAGDCVARYSLEGMVDAFVGVVEAVA